MRAQGHSAASAPASAARAHDWTRSLSFICFYLIILIVSSMGCGGSRSDAIEPRRHESWTRETESTWLTSTDADCPNNSISKHRIIYFIHRRRDDVRTPCVPCSMIGNICAHLHCTFMQSANHAAAAQMHYIIQMQVSSCSAS